MIVRATSDLHLTEHTAPWVFAALGELRADAEACGGVTVLCGDILDQPRTVHMPTYNQLRELLVRWPGDVIILAGNHDQYDAPRHALEALAASNVVVVSAPMQSVLGPMIPYTAPAVFGPALAHVMGQRAKGYGPDVIWSHHGFRGAYRNAMMRDRDGVSTSEVPQGHLVITGHYHCPQVIGRVIYCGSPYQTTFAEEGQRKGWLRWGSFYDDVMPVRVAYRSVGAPQHWTIDWDPASGAFMGVGARAYKGTDKVRVRTTAPRKVAMAAVQQLRAAGLDAYPLLSAPDTGRDVVDVTSGATPRDLALQYVDRVGGKDGMPEAPVMRAWAEEVKLWG